MRLEKHPEGHRVRLRFGKGERGRFVIPIHDEARAHARAEAMQALVDLLPPEVDRKRWLEVAAEADAEKFARIQAKARQIGNEPAKPRPTRTGLTVDQYHALWAADRDRKGRVSERGRYLKHVQPILGDKLISNVRPDDLRAVVESLDDKVIESRLNWATSLKVWGIVTKLFSDAVRSKVATLRVLQSNPCRDVQGPDRGNRTAKQWLYPDEAIALLSCDAVPIRWRELYALSIYLYPRPGELAALEWSDVHLDQGFVHIHQALNLRTGETKSTKTGHTRKVPIPDALYPLLERMRGTGRVIKHSHANKSAEHGFPPLEDLADTLRGHLLRAGVDRVDLHERRPTTKRVTFYDLRATGITWEALAKTDPLAIQQRAGHTDFKTTQGYIREADAVGAKLGSPFPDLPEGVGQGVGQRSVTHRNPSKKAASPTGFEREAGDPSCTKPQENGLVVEPENARSDPTGPVGPGGGPAIDPVETALADALKRATAAEQWETVALLTRELTARREARARVVHIGTARAKRGR